MPLDRGPAASQLLDKDNDNALNYEEARVAPPSPPVLPRQAYLFVCRAVRARGHTLRFGLHQAPLCAARYECAVAAVAQRCPFVDMGCDLSDGDGKLDVNEYITAVGVCVGDYAGTSEEFRCVALGRRCLT
jgi:hypothetical protein